MALASIQSCLNEAMYLSGQQSYKRRYPGDDLMQTFQAIKNELLQLYFQKEMSVLNQSGILLALSQVSEAILDFGAAENYLIEWSNRTADRSNRTLKRLTLLRASAAHWKVITLCPSDLEKMRDFVDKQIASQGPGSDFVYCRAWLAGTKYDQEQVIDRFRSLGLADDFQVAANLP
jgi:hypothetical protein